MDNISLRENDWEDSRDGFILLKKSFSAGVLTCYSINNETAFRFRFAMSRFYEKRFRNEYSLGDFKESSTTERQNILNFAPGISWKMNSEKLDFICGFEIPFNYHGQYLLNWVIKESDSITGALKASTVNKTTIPLGYSFGISALFGFNYYLKDYLSLGAEISASLLYAKLTGEVICANYLGTSYIQDGETGFGYYNQRFSINLSFWL